MLCISYWIPLLSISTPTCLIGIAMESSFPITVFCFSLVLVIVTLTSGQMTEEEPAAKKAKVAKKPDSKPAVQEAHVSRSVDVPSAQLYQPNTDVAAGVVPESQLYQDASLLAAPLAPPAAPVVPAPAVSSVSITRRDPRMARHTSSSVTVTYSAPEKSSSSSSSAEAFTAPVSTPLMDIAPKLPLPLPLPMPPAPPPSVPKPAKTRCS